MKARRGVISSLALSNGIWDINQGLLTADRVFLATGSHPRDDQLYPGPTVVPLDDALIPSKLSGTAFGFMQVTFASNRRHRQAGLQIHSFALACLVLV